MAKVQDVARFFVNLAAQQAELKQNDPMTNMRLQKMLYFAQGHMLARHGVPLFEDDIEAWQYGPVVRNTYLAYKGNEGNSIPEGDKVNLDAFTPDELNLLLDVMAAYEQYSTSGLVELTHKQTPWQNSFQDDEKTTISKDAIYQAFHNSKPLPSGRDRIRSRQVEQGTQRPGGQMVFPNDLAKAWDA